MSIIIKLLGLPLEASSVDVRLYFLGITIPDGGVHIVGGDYGTVFIEFSSDEDARQAMSKGDGTIKNSNIKLLLSSRTEMQSVIDATRFGQQQYLQHQQQQTWMLPLNNHQQGPPQLNQQSNFQLNLGQPISYFLSNVPPMGPALLQTPTQQQQQQPMPQPLNQPTVNFESDPRMQSQNYQGIMNVMNQQTDSKARMSGMRGGDDKLFANKKCVLAATNIPYRATSKDIIEFLSEFNIREDCIRRRYNQKGQPTADAKIAFPTPDAAVKALKMMNKKTLCGRPVFFKPV